MTRAVLKFIDAGPLGETQAALIRQQIRSHAARSGANESSSGSATATNAPRKRQRRQHTTWTVELPLREAPANGNDPASESSSPLTPLSGTGMIPAAESPVYHEPFVSVVLHNYLQHLAVAIPEIDGEGQSALLKTRWFPLVINSPIVFQVIVLFSASHYASQRQDTAFAETILWLKHCALNGISRAVAVSKGFIRDEIIAATAKMASYEAIYGEGHAYHKHMQGVEDMLQVRGGLHTLGLDGFLSRLLIFIDTNSAFLLNTHLHLSASTFPRLAPFLLPNPSRFIGEV